MLINNIGPVTSAITKLQDKTRHKFVALFRDRQILIQIRYRIG